jgi:hypothetical protein
MKNEQLRELALKDVRPYDGCSFLSGHSGSSHDNPILYARGNGFVVLARGVRKKFALAVSMRPWRLTKPLWRRARTESTEMRQSGDFQDSIISG